MRDFLCVWMLFLIVANAKSQTPATEMNATNLNSRKQNLQSSTIVVVLAASKFAILCWCNAHCMYAEMSKKNGCVYTSVVVVAVSIQHRFASHSLSFYVSFFLSLVFASFRNHFTWRNEEIRMHTQPIVLCNQLIVLIETEINLIQIILVLLVKNRSNCFNTCSWVCVRAFVYYVECMFECFSTTNRCHAQRNVCACCAMLCYACVYSFRTMILCMYAWAYVCVCVRVEFRNYFTCFDVKALTWHLWLRKITSKSK